MTHVGNQAVRGHQRVGMCQTQGGRACLGPVGVWASGPDGPGLRFWCAAHQLGGPGQVAGNPQVPWEAVEWAGQEQGFWAHTELGADLAVGPWALVSSSVKWV